MNAAPLAVEVVEGMCRSVEEEGGGGGGVVAGGSSPSSVINPDMFRQEQTELWSIWYPTPGVLIL